MLLLIFVWYMIFAMTIPQPDPDRTVELFQGASFVFGLVTTVICYFLFQFNTAKSLEQRINANKSSINAIKLRNTDLFDKANRLIEKHQVTEKESYIDIAKASGTRQEETREVVDKQKIAVDTKTEIHVRTSEEFGRFIKEFPELTHNQNVKRLLDQLADNENHLANSKITFNQCVEAYNTIIHQFPLSLIRKMAKLEDKEYYQEDITDADLGL